MALLKSSDNESAIELSLFSSEIDTKEMVEIKLSFIYGKKYPVISNKYDGNEVYEIENILDVLFDFLAGKQSDNYTCLNTLDDDFVININKNSFGFRIEAHMDTPSMVFSTNRKGILDFMLSLAKEYRKVCPQGNMSMIEKAYRVLGMVDSKKKTHNKISKDEWKAFCLYALYIDETGIIPKTGSFRALSELKKGIYTKLILRGKKTK